MTPAAIPTRWLTVHGAAAQARTSARTIYRECAAGRLRHARVGGRRDIRLLPEWIDQWLIDSSTPVEVRRG